MPAKIYYRLPLIIFLIPPWRSLAALLLGLQPWQSLATQSIDEHIVVSANRSQQQQFSVLASTEVISQHQIEQSQSDNLGQLLDGVAGIHVASQGGGGQVQSIYMRGTNANHTLVLLDGIKIASSSLGYANISAINMAMIERVEIVKGPRAALWGSDAIGGVIQLFSKSYQANEGAAALQLGSHQYQQAYSGFGLGDSDNSLSVAFSAEKSDGFNAYQTDPFEYDINEPDIDGFKRFSTYSNGKLTIIDNWLLTVNARKEHSYSDYDASYPDLPCFSEPAKTCPVFYANQQLEKNDSIKISSHYKLDWLQHEFSYSYLKQHALTYGNGIDKQQGEQITTQKHQWSTLNHYQLSPHVTVALGAELLKESVSSNSDIAPSVEGFQSWQKTSRDTLGVFLLSQSQWYDWLFDLVIRRDDIDYIGSENSYNISLGYQLSDSQLVAISQSRGFKAPSFNDLYWPSAGNPNLRAETANSKELLFRQRLLLTNIEGHVELVLFENHIDNLISWQPNDFGLWQPQNIDRAEIRGIDIALTANHQALSHTFALSYVNSEDRSNGKPLMRRPQKTASYQLQLNFDRWYASSGIYYHSDSDDVSATLPAYHYVNIGLGFDLSDQVSFNVNINNALNQRYQSAANYIADRRNVKLAWRIHF
ncbi:TonB-dependent receptor [Thalassotalea ponticola]|uniref:TonB-dependent receptor domain-containing protein n=1 Tax=Thalassotalea ponticola TaxID=1523392 RepID=UPI0025B2C7D1|nr:TonB-dependent receptor [Thalassotalea ponticola]MDN3652216.1 TonB-dependent receptor [Thalassotalea ponticola]